MKPPACPICNYNLQGLGDESRRCPECGAIVHVDPVTLRARMRDPVHLRVNYVFGLLVLILLAPILHLCAYLELPFPPVALILAMALGALAVVVGIEIYNSHYRKRSRPWDLVFAASEDGVVLRSAFVPIDVKIEITWRRLQWIRCKLFRGNPTIRLEETFGSLARWIELDCSWASASVTVKNLNWFRHAVNNARPAR